MPTHSACVSFYFFFAVVGLGRIHYFIPYSFFFTFFIYFSVLLLLFLRSLHYSLYSRSSFLLFVCFSLFIISLYLYDTDVTTTTTTTTIRTMDTNHAKKKKESKNVDIKMWWRWQKRCLKFIYVYVCWNSLRKSEYIWVDVDTTLIFTSWQLYIQQMQQLKLTLFALERALYIVFIFILSYSLLLSLLSLPPPFLSIVNMSQSTISFVVCTFVYIFMKLHPICLFLLRPKKMLLKYFIWPIHSHFLLLWIYYLMLNRFG